MERLSGHPEDRAGLPADRCHQPQSGGGGAARSVPVRSLLPAERHPHPHPPPAAAEGGHRPHGHQFLARFCGEYNKSLTCSPRFLAFLEQYDWPGNVRQLENLMERLVITAQDPILDIPALPLEYTADASAPAELLPGGTLAERMDAYEAQIIRDSYQRCGTTVAVGPELGSSQATAARKIAKYVTARA